MRRVYLLLFFLFACSNPTKTPVGVWEMGPVTEPRSNNEAKLPAAEWAKNISQGGELTLTSEGAIYSARAPIESARLEGSWQKNEISFAWEESDAHNAPNVFRYSGLFDQEKDAIFGTITQELHVGPLVFTLVGK